MIDFTAFKYDLSQSSVAGWENYFETTVRKKLAEYTHGELDEWQSLLINLPDLTASHFELLSQVSVGTQEDIQQQLDSTQIETLVKQLKVLHPWRKGPFDFFGIHIDTEWRSDWKWDRIKKHLSPLNNRTVLDVGCGNGYHCWRMLGEQAKLVLGIDPSQKFLAQFSVIKKYMGKHPVHLLPLGIEDMPTEMGKTGFDTVFSMGVLYHRKSPINHLIALKNLLGPKGELILETLVIDGDENQILVPEGRYAQMRNVWFLPSVKALTLWLKKVGFKKIKTVSIDQTSVQEQRSTEWMTFHSLKDYLDPNDSSKTIEGYPSPKRAVIIANK